MALFTPAQHVMKNLPADAGHENMKEECR